MVPGDLKARVNRTVGRRADAVDASWAPWWAAQSAAIVYVLRLIFKTDADVAKINKIEAKDKEFVRKLKARA
jgi:hypothetical protein